MAIAKYDDEADVLYVEFERGNVARTVALSDLRLVDEDRDGRVLGIEFISASEGIDLDGVPRAAEVQQAIAQENLAIPLVA